MDRTPMPTPLAAALALAQTSGRSPEIFRDGDLEIRFAAKLPDGLHAPHPRDEVYIVAAGSGHYRFEDRVMPVGAGDLLFAAAHVPHGLREYVDRFLRLGHLLRPAEIAIEICTCAFRIGLISPRRARIATAADGGSTHD